MANGTKKSLMKPTSQTRHPHITTLKHVPNSAMNYTTKSRTRRNKKRHSRHQNQREKRSGGIIGIQYKKWGIGRSVVESGIGVAIIRQRRSSYKRIEWTKGIEASISTIKEKNQFLFKDECQKDDDGKEMANLKSVLPVPNISRHLESMLTSIQPTSTSASLSDWRYYVWYCQWRHSPTRVWLGGARHRGIWNWSWPRLIWTRLSIDWHIFVITIRIEEGQWRNTGVTTINV